VTIREDARIVMLLASVLAAQLALAARQQARAAPAARPLRVTAQPRLIVLDVHGSVEDAAALCATLHELTERRGLVISFELLGDDPTPSTTAPWATLAVQLGGPEASDGPALLLREGAAGRVRLRRVVPSGANRQVTVETLATIAYTALETMAAEEAARPAGHAASTPRERAGLPPAHDRQQTEPPGPAPEPPARPAADEGVPGARAPATTPAAAAPAPDAPPPTHMDDAPLAVSSRASASLLASGAPPLPVRFSLASFAGYQAANLLTRDRRVSPDAWGVGLSLAAGIPRWALEPTLSLGLGSWYATSREPRGGDTSSDGYPRPAPGPRLQGQAEVRLTVLHLARFRAAIGPWMTLSRATYDLGPAPLGRGPGPNQPNLGADPSGADGLRFTHTDVGAGLVARIEASISDRVALYCAFAGATPLTARPLPIEGHPQSVAPSELPPATIRWTLSAFAGLTVAVTGE